VVVIVNNRNPNVNPNVNPRYITELMTSQDVIVRPLSTVGYMSIAASVIHSRQYK